MRRHYTAALALASFAGAASAQEAFRPLFNGQDLTGWVNVNCAPDTWTARDGMIVCSGRPTGVLRTDRRYENFVLELEYRHLHAGGNAGLFVWSDPLTARGQPFTRSIEVQVMDGVETENYTSHGDIFSIHGARMTPDRPHPSGWERCLPSERRARPAPEWNHYRVTCVDGAIKLAVNGREVSGGHDVAPRKGYICLESEGSEVHFRNLKIQELPAAGAPVVMAEPDLGFRSLFNGQDLNGWKLTAAGQGHWKVQDWVLDYDGQGDHLWSWEEFGDFQLIVDWRWSGAPHDADLPVIAPDGTHALDAGGQPMFQRVAEYGDSGIYLRGNDKSQVNIWCWPVGSGEVYGYRTDAGMPAAVRAAVTPRVNADAPPGRWNRFLITMVGDRLTVVLNGQTVIENAQLPGVPARGPIALQHHGAPLQFANVYVRELDGVRADVPQHAATLPAPSPYDWARPRVAELERRAREQAGARLVFLGDSITEGWEGNGHEIWREKLAPLGAVGLGVSGDETAHVLWRLQQGHLDPLRPKAFVLMLGTNNAGNAGHGPRQIADGVQAVLADLLWRFPGAKVLLLGVFPRGQQPDDPLRRSIAAANQLLERLADHDRVHYLDIGAAFLEPDGTLSAEVMPDYLHLSPLGYRRWYEAIAPKLQQLLP